LGLEEFDKMVRHGTTKNKKCLYVLCIYALSIDIQIEEIPKSTKIMEAP
jgi:hypothetical protein